jgi:5-methylcytosine-specific restriction enzyme subunit McrC
MPIPVHNLYYLLCYAWDEFAPKQLERVAKEEFSDALHLFASLLDSGIRSLHQRGLETGYVTFEQPTSAPRGRILMTQSIPLIVTQPGRVCCAYDEMSPDVLTNQILKATLKRILGTDGLPRNLRQSVRHTHRLLDQVSSIDLTPRVFYQVRLHQNNRLYGFLINVCRFLFDSLQPLERAGEYRFQDVLREPERLRRIYEKFVRNFYRRSQKAFTVKKDRMNWTGAPLDDSEFGLLPQMETDVTLRSRNRVIIIECKYTDSMYQRNYFAGKFRSPHLYQLAAYLRNLDDDAEGILLYPTAGISVNQRYELQGHRLRIATVDLNKPWREIAESLLKLLIPERGQLQEMTA